MIEYFVHALIVIAMGLYCYWVWLLMKIDDSIERFLKDGKNDS